MVSGAMVEQVRRFNRVVTERVGVLNDRFLGRGSCRFVEFFELSLGPA